MTADELSIFDHSPDGGLRTAWRGYDKQQVERHIRSLETTIGSLRKALAARVGSPEFEDALAEIRAAPPTTPDLATYSGLGGRIQHLLQLAENQANQLVDSARAEADEILRDARRQANQGSDQS